MREDARPTLDADRARVVDELKEMILAIEPSATFQIDFGMGDDPDGIYLIATLDMDEPFDIYDEITDYLLHVQVEERLQVYVIPERTPERAEALLREQRRRYVPSVDQDIHPK